MSKNVSRSIVLCETNSPTRINIHAFGSIANLVGPRVMITLGGRSLDGIEVTLSTNLKKAREIADTINECVNEVEESVA